LTSSGGIVTVERNEPPCQAKNLQSTSIQLVKVLFIQQSFLLILLPMRSYLKKLLISVGVIAALMLAKKAGA